MVGRGSLTVSLDNISPSSLLPSLHLAVVDMQEDILRGTHSSLVLSRGQSFFEIPGKVSG